MKKKNLKNNIIKLENEELLIDFEGDFNELSNILSDLKDEGLVYYSDNYQGITSIIRI